MTKLLLAEDETDLRDMMATFFKSKGYEVAACRDGLAAWQRLQRERPDVAILDVHMPRMSGYELCQRIRLSPGLRSLPVIMLTVMSSVPSQVEGYEAGADDYLPKPFSFPVLLARIRALERRAGRAAA
jgi:DNA-binding response OmpR family regulator